MPPLRSSLLLAVVLALVFASGAGAAQIDFDDDLDMLRVVDFAAAADQLTIQERATSHDVTDPSGTLADNSGLCTAIANGFRCPKATSIAVDLGAANDVFHGPTSPSRWRSPAAPATRHRAGRRRRRRARRRRRRRHA